MQMGGGHELDLKAMLHKDYFKGNIMTVVHR